MAQMPPEVEKALVEILRKKPDVAAAGAAWIDRESDTEKGAENVCNLILICWQGDN